MTAPTGVRTGVGLRASTLFLLDSNGYIAAASPTTPYEGVKFIGGKVHTVNDKEPRTFWHAGDDRIVNGDMLPPLEGVTGEMQMGVISDVVDALIADQKAFTVGTGVYMGGGTNKRGFEAQVGLLSFQHAVDADQDAGSNGLGGWNSLIYPNCRLFRREVGMVDQIMSRPYTILPAIVSKHIWGTAFVEGTEGFTSAQFLSGYTRGRPKLIAWQGNNTLVEFSFPVLYPAIVASVSVWLNGVLTIPTTVTTTKITMATAPGTGVNMTVAYEY
jgi:hypothetical protein